MMRFRKTRTWVITAIGASAISLSGCRSLSRVPVFGRFAGSPPSADTLAAAEPTSAFPQPPSNSATPQAIASIAGGTAVPATSTPGVPSRGLSVPGAQPPGLGLPGSRVASNALPGTNFPYGGDPGQSASPEGPYGGVNSLASAKSSASPVSYAAAAANGFPSQNSTSNATTPSASSSESGGGFKMPPLTPPSTSGSGSSYQLADSGGSPAVGNAAPTPQNSGFSIPDSMTQGAAAVGLAANENVDRAVAASPSTQGAYILPDQAMASVQPTGEPQKPAPPMELTMPPLPDSTVAGAASSSSPSASVAHAAAATTPNSAPVARRAGYAPGSTGSASSYPSSKAEAPSASGSFYR
ncbi:MAG: hypothetical protein AAF664_12785 [Planctomycetota bacterium]